MASINEFDKKNELYSVHDEFWRKWHLANLELKLIFLLFLPTFDVSYGTCAELTFCKIPCDA